MAHHDDQMEQHMGRRGWKQAQEERQDRTADEGPTEMEDDTPTEMDDTPTEIDPQQEDFNRRTDTDDDEEDEEDEEDKPPFLANFSEDAMNTAWDALTILKYR